MSPRTPQRFWSTGKRTIDLTAHTLIMGILNVTPDSFYDGGRFAALERAVEQGLRLVDDGADILDIGGESTRPGAEAVPEGEELERVLPVIERLAGRISVPISIDTTKSSVAAAALDAGAEIVNDISAGRFDPAMAGVVAQKHAGLVLMHIKGEPRTMQLDPQYDDVVRDICDSLRGSMNAAIAAGLAPQQIVIDPGIGFGKQLEHNLQILRRLREFEILGRPILVGPSRKSFIGKILDLPPEERLEGTIAASVIAILNGAAVVRVHDVRAAKRAALIADAVLGHIDVSGN